MSHPQDFTPVDLPRDGRPPSGEPLHEFDHTRHHAVELARVRASLLSIPDPQPSA